MKSPQNPLVITKIRVPAARGTAVPRPRLIERMSAANASGVLLAVAPAGYGKTTVLGEWARRLVHGGTPVAWYSLDPADDDPAVFGAYLAAALADAFGPEAGFERAAGRLRDSSETGRQDFAVTILHAAAADGREGLLVLDDFHVLSSPVIHAAVSYLADHLPEHFRIALGSRLDPPLPIARWRAAGRLVELRAADLQFTESETDAFLNGVMKLDLPPDSLAFLESRTEGWVAGLQLAGLSLAGKSKSDRALESFSGGHRFLADYLLEEIVNALPEGERSFLLATSILERMCGPLCDSLTGGEGSGGELLSRLENDNVFVVPLDDERRWFRYHNLFREFLQHRLLREAPGRIPLLHRAACEWLARQGLLREAAGHALESGDWIYAAAFVEERGFELITHGQIQELDRWCRAFPEEVLRSHPLIRILQCWGQVFRFRRGNRAAVETRLAQAEQAIAGVADARSAAELRVHAGVVRSFLQMVPDPAADPRAFLAEGMRMLEGSPVPDAGRFSAQLMIGYARLAMHEAAAAEADLLSAWQTALSEGLHYGIVEAAFHLSRLAHVRGDIRRGEEYCRTAREQLSAPTGEGGWDLPALGALDVDLGCILLEQDRLDEAEGKLRMGMQAVGAGLNPFYRMTAAIALASLEEMRARPSEAAAYLANLETAWPDIAFCTEGLRLQSLLRSAPGDPFIRADLAVWLSGPAKEMDGNAAQPGMGPFGAAEVFHLAYLARACALTTIGKTGAALETITAMLAPALANGLAARVVALSMLEAQAAQAAGDERRMDAAMERALAVGEPAGFIRGFDRGVGVENLLDRAVLRGIHRDYATRLRSILTRSRLRPPARPPAEFGPVEDLSERELEILRLAAEGATNQSIAERLVITVGTVKSHLNHILRKLDSANRTEAAARARSLGLI